MNSVVILMCTWSAYSEVAKASCHLIDQYWPNHPDIFIVGGDQIENRHKIPYSSSEKDWIGMAYEAVQWLEGKGAKYCYLIIDDHPPVGPCNSNFLNVTLPDYAEQLGATRVALAGWDQFQPNEGELIQVGEQKWFLNSSSHKWKFNLHPGLWNLADLGTILEKVMRFSPRVYSARSFESVSGSEALSLPPQFIRKTYKINGDLNSSGNHWLQRRIIRKGVRHSYNLARLVARAAGNQALISLDRKMSVYTHYINGPYPIYWSGILKKGKLSRNLLKFAQLTNNNKLKAYIDSLPSHFISEVGAED